MLCLKDYSGVVGVLQARASFTAMEKDYLVAPRASLLLWKCLASWADWGCISVWFCSCLKRNEGSWFTGCHSAVESSWKESARIRIFVSGEFVNRRGADLF